MKRSVLIIAILCGMTLGAFAQHGHREGDVTYAPIALPEHELSENQDASIVSTKPQTVSLDEGANWVSFYVNTTLDDLKSALVAALPTGNSTMITIKSRNQNVKYQRGRWSGSLTALDMTQMYTVIVSEACEITLEDMPVDPSTLTAAINPGANWIAFPYETSMTVANFFAGFAQDQDQVKARTTNSKYQRGRWGGSLTTLESGQGYIYVSADSNPRTFTFPTSAK